MVLKIEVSTSFLMNLVKVFKIMYKCYDNRKEQAMTAIRWDDKLSVNIKIIDNQHKHFISLINIVYEVLESKNTKKLPDVIKDLTSYADHHFKTEEEYFDKFHYPDADLHKAAHNKLRAKVDSFTNRQGDPIAIGFELLYFLERWLLIHFKGTDKKFAEFLKQNGVK